MKLYELASEYRSFLEAVENGEIPEECIADTLEAITGEIEVKADNIACLLKDIDGDIAKIKAEENNLAERRKQLEKFAENIKKYLSDTLLHLGINKVESARNKITFRKSEAVEVADEFSFIEWCQKNDKDDYLTYKAPTVNKTAIKSALKDGAKIDGAILISKQNIQIR